MTSQSHPDLFNPVPTKVKDAKFGADTADPDSILWVDNQSAIATAKDSDFKPKSRHYALRYLRVRGYARRIVFCPTNLMRADALTKLECSLPQRQLLLHQVSNPVTELECDSSFEDDDLSVYSVYFGF